MPAPTDASPTAVSPEDGNPQDYVIQRDGDRDLAFTSWLIGYAEGSTAWYETQSRVVKVSIFGTTKSSLVLQACRFNESSADDEVMRHHAKNCCTRTAR